MKNIMIRVTKEMREEIQRAANMTTNGNVSEYFRRLHTMVASGELSECAKCEERNNANSPK